MISQPETLLSRIARDLNVDESFLRKHLLSNSLHALESCGFSFLRFKHACGPVEEGTMVFQAGGRLEYLRGFPKIRRLYGLGSGLKRNFSSSFYAEEKMDGYNVRCARVGGSFTAVTKGGLPCPYSTQKLRKLDSSGFFADNPSLMLCGEVVGLANPYQTKSYPHARDFGFFVFDVRDRTSGRALPPEKRYQLLHKYGFTGVKVFGRYNARSGKKLLALVRRLGEAGGEGLVFKSLDGQTQVKYTSSQSTNRDLRYAFRFPFDYAQAFFFRRLVREAFQAHELGLQGAALRKEALKLGESILIPLVETIRMVARGKEVTEDFDLLVPSRDFGRAFVEHLRHLGVRASIARTRKSGKQWRMRVKRHYPATNDKTRAYLKGEFGSE
ncbi:RNA ligase [archaeon]|nr:RNA ligase [archaeon]